ncbi:SDR family oxidoreductase [Lacibacter luteus]|nr:SDR family oxidoreductase [Lacibacter luteus]
MSTILITGGTGTLGKSLSALLSSQNIPHMIGSRNAESGKDHNVTMDLLQNKAVKEAVEGKQVIFHLATDLKKDALLTQNLLQAIGTNRNIHLVYISIVGIDKVPFAYYKQKLASENAIKASGIPFTILRATQFHEFIHQIITTFLKFPVGLLPKKIISQPIDASIVAAELYRLSKEEPVGKTIEIGGAEALTLEEMANEWMEQSGKKKLIFNLPIWGELGRTFCNGSLTTANSVKHSKSWRQWLAQHLVEK